MADNLLGAPAQGEDAPARRSADLEHTVAEAARLLERRLHAPPRPTSARAIALSDLIAELREVEHLLALDRLASRLGSLGGAFRARTTA